MPTRSYSVRDIYNWKFEQHSIPEEWLRHLGDVPQRFHIYVDGDAKNGKSEYVIMLTKMLAVHIGKVRLNNIEEGKHKHIQQSIVRNKFKDDVPAGKFQYDSIKDFEKYKERILRPNSGRFHIIDSISYWPLNEKQIQELVDPKGAFKNKSFIFVAYKAHAARNKPIVHLTDIQVTVEDFIAYPVSRFGGNQNLVVWDRKKQPAQVPLFNN